MDTPASALSFIALLLSLLSRSNAPRRIRLFLLSAALICLVNTFVMFVIHDTEHSPMRLFTVAIGVLCALTLLVASFSFASNGVLRSRSQRDVVLFASTGVLLINSVFSLLNNPDAFTISLYLLELLALVHIVFSAALLRADCAEMNH
jgi:peptidoglycan/LPS O-acetylase OafA/YrhL